MKAIVVLSSILLIATCKADGDGLGSTTEEPRFRFTQPMCVRTEPSLYVDVMTIAKKCLEMGVTKITYQQYKDAQTLEDYRDFFQKFCNKQTLVRQCLADTTVDMEVCQNKTLLDTFKITRDVLEALLDFGCDEEGEKLGYLWYEMNEYFKLPKKDTVAAKKCLERYEVMFVTLDRSKVDISSKLYNLHKQIIMEAECVYQVELKPSFKVALKTFVDVIINRMKCVHPQDGTLVPCATIDAGMIKVSNICDVKRFGIDSDVSFYDILEEDSGSRLADITNYADEDMSTNDRIREVVDTECKQLSGAMPYLFKEFITLSEVCLNETERNEFKLFGDFFESAQEVVCREDGRRVAEVLYEFYRLKRTGNGNAIWDCVDVAQSTRNVTDDHRSSSKNMRFYHELEAFKTCLMNKLQGDQTSVDATTWLAEELLRKVKCVHPGDGTTVLCEALHTT